MPLRLIEIFLPADENIEWMEEALHDYPTLGFWHNEISNDLKQVKILLSSEDTRAVVELIEERYSDITNLRIILLPVEGTVPRPPPEKKVEKNSDKKIVKGLARQELYADVSAGAKLTRIFLVLVVLSSVVASVGILKNNVAIIIGAMIIAPLLGPNMALAFGTTLGDMALIRQALKVNIAGLSAAVALSVLIGMVISVDPAIPELASRTTVGLDDIVLALASGVVGALCFTKGMPAAIIGVMVAVALLPPLVSFGMLLGSAHFQLAGSALLLLLVNIICVNLAGTTTFLAEGIRPIAWWEAGMAKKATRFAIAIWTALLILLTFIIILSKKS